MNLSKFKITNKGLYWGLIITFLFLYVFVAFVSTLHAIDFFKLANVGSLAVLLGISYEVGQASVLFSILMTKNKEKFLPWALMFLLTGLQITANVYASFKHMMTSGSTDWVFWQKSILFGVQASSPEMYQVIISWISGALLPIIALGMTSLVAQQIKMITEENEHITPAPTPTAEDKPKEVAPEEPAKPEPEKDEQFDLNDWFNRISDENREKIKNSFLRDVMVGTRENSSEKYAQKGPGSSKVVSPQMESEIILPPSVRIVDGVPVDLNMQDAIDEATKKLSPKTENFINLQNKISDIVENKLSKDSEELAGYGMEGDYLDEEVKRLVPPKEEIAEKAAELPEPIRSVMSAGTHTVEVEPHQIKIDNEFTIPTDVPVSVDLTNIPEKTGEQKMQEYIEEKFGGATEEDLQPITDAINDKILQDLKDAGTKKMPQTLKRGWHLKKRYVDSNGDVYSYGEFQPLEKGKPEEPKKA